MVASAAAAAVSYERPVQDVYTALPKAIQLETKTDSLVDRYNRVRGIQSGNPTIDLSRKCHESVTKERDGTNETGAIGWPATDRLTFSE